MNIERVLNALLSQWGGDVPRSADLGFEIGATVANAIGGFEVRRSPASWEGGFTWIATTLFCDVAWIDVGSAQLYESEIARVFV